VTALLYKESTLLYHTNHSVTDLPVFVSCCWKAAAWTSFKCHLPKRPNPYTEPCNYWTDSRSVSTAIWLVHNAVQHVSPNLNPARRPCS